jgi:hypothetical protein
MKVNELDPQTKQALILAGALGLATYGGLTIAKNAATQSPDKQDLFTRGSLGPVGSIIYDFIRGVSQS